MNMTIRAMTPAERSYCYSQSQQISMQTGLIGHLRADMDNNGKGFFTTFFDFRAELKTEDFNREITVDQIHKKQECMIKAAALMKDSGFAGVDLHAAHWGYLLDNFLMPIANHREDEYGGCLENRVRVITEMVEGIHQVCGSDFAVTIGLGVKSFITALN